MGNRYLKGVNIIALFAIFFSILASFLTFSYSLLFEREFAAINLLFLSGLVISIISLIFSAKIYKKEINCLIKTSYWINILAALGVILFFIYGLFEWIYASGDYGISIITLIGAQISLVFFVLSFIVFFIGYFKLKKSELQ